MNRSVQPEEIAMLSTLSAAASAASSVIDWPAVAEIAVDVIGAVIKAFL